MMIIVSSFLIVTAIFGVILLCYLVSNKNTPKSFVITHGFLAFIGILFFAYYVVTHHFKFIDLLLLLALGGGLGIYITYHDILNLPIPKKTVVLHGSIAILVVSWLIIRIM